MSKYTTEVRFICESYANLQESEGYDKIPAIVERARPKIFDFDYPIFDENYRKTLETKILRHYYTREICCETVGLWKQMLSTKMNEIMPYFNKLYESELLSFNPFYNLDYTRDFEKTNKDSGEGSISRNLTGNNSTTTSATTVVDGEQKKTGTETTASSGTVRDTGTITDSGTTGNTRTLDTEKTTTNSGSDTENSTEAAKNTRWDIYSDTPQGALTNVQNETYLTNARKIVDDGTGTTKGKTTNYGKVISEEEDGTITDAGTSTNTRTLNTTSTLSSNETTTFNTKVENDVETTFEQDVAGVRGETETTTSTKGFDGLENYLEHMKGKNSAQSFSKMLMEFRETFMNIDMMVIENLSDLFFLLW